MSSAQIVAAMRATAIFASVDDVTVHDLVEHSRLRTLKRRQILFDRDAQGDSLVVVVSGRLKVSVRSADGGEFALALVGPGETLGELSVVDGGNRSADCEAIEESIVVLVDRVALLRSMRSSAELADQLLRSVAANLRRLTEAAADLVFLDLPRRVAKLLVELPRGADGEVDLTMSQEELAHHVGGTRQSINAALRGFERRGWLQVSSRRITLVDVSALIDFAGR
jgi:CRP-like cAMP-binding protein